MKNKLDPINAAMRHRNIMLLMVAVLVLFGIYALVVMPKNEFPDFTIRQGVVVGVYPGATSSEVEEQLTKPLEKFLWEFKEIKKEKTYSQSKDGVCYVFVELGDEVSNKDEFWSKFKLRLEQFKSQLPSGVLALIANDDFGDTSAMLITLESEDKTYRQLHDYMTMLQDSLRTIPELGNLRVTGEQQEQISVYIDRERLSQYGLNTATLMSSLSGQGLQIISGSLDDGATVRPIHVRSLAATENDIAEQIIFSDPMGNVVRLRDVAQIKREYADMDSYVENNGKKCLVLSVEMKAGNNIVDFGDQVKAKIEDFENTLPDDVSIYTITDQSYVVGHSVTEFLGELLIAIIAVIISIMLLLPWRVASVAASSIPITIFASLGIFFACGIEMNTVTLAALIITLGMIVDNCIVIIDCYIEKLDEGMSRWHAAQASAKEFFGSIFSATLAISVTFFPFLTLTGIFKDFLKFFPWAMLIVLMVSLIVAVLVVPYFQYTFIKKGLKREVPKHTFLDLVQETYNKLIEACFRHPFITLGMGAASVVASAFGLMQLQQKLLPTADRNQFAVEITMPNGTAMERTRVVADSLRRMLSHDERVLNITTFYGSGSPRFHMCYAPQIGGTNFAQFVVNTPSVKATEALLDEYGDRYTHYFHDAHIKFKQLEYTEASYPIEIRLFDNDLEALHEASDSVVRMMHHIDELTLVSSSFEDPTPGLDVVMNADEATRLGINKTLLSVGLATRYMDGLPVTTVWEGDYPIKVNLKDMSMTGGNNNPEAMQNATVSGIIPGVSVPLRQVADVVPMWSEGCIMHRNGVRTVSVHAELKRGANNSATTDKMIETVQQLKLPEGVTYVVGGQRLHDMEVVPKIMGCLLMAIAIIAFILIFHFKNIRLAMLIFTSLVFSVPGTAFGIWVMGQDLSVTGILGIVSVMGIIVRNGIIMIDYAEELRIGHRMPAKHAALDAAKRRMRPIFLTSAAASIGVIPMVIKNTSLWGPMGIVVCFGTLIAMLFIITMIPVGYWMIFRIQDKKRNNLKTTVKK